MIKMKKYNFDMKLSENLSGELIYIKYDYINNTELQYQFQYHNGQLDIVTVVNGENIQIYWMDEEKNKHKFNQEFWKLAPKNANFDDCRWERKSITFNLEGLYTYPWPSKGTYANTYETKCIL